MTAITGVILAGGQGRRMGGKDKGLLLLHGKPLYQYALNRLRPQVEQIIIVANRHADIYARSGFQIIADRLADYPGPMAGMLTALQHAPTSWVVFCACDMPAIPADYVQRLWQQKQSAKAVWVRSETRDQPLLALLHISLATPMMETLAARKHQLIAFLRQHGQAVQFSDNEQAFINLNTPQELARYTAGEAR